MQIGSHLEFQTFLHHPSISKRLPDNALESVLVPLDGLGLVDAVAGADPALRTPPLRNALSRSGHAAVEVHAVDTEMN